MSRHTFAGRAVLVTVCVILPTACAVFDAFAPTGAASSVSWVYVGPECMLVAERAHFQVTLLVDGVPLPEQRLRTTITPAGVVSLTAGGDTLVADGAGTAALDFQVVHSTIGSDAPDTAVSVRVRVANCGGPP